MFLELENYRVGGGAGGGVVKQTLSYQGHYIFLHTGIYPYLIKFWKHTVLSTYQPLADFFGSITDRFLSGVVAIACSSQLIIEIVHILYSIVVTDAQPRNSFTWANPVLRYRNLARQYCSIVGVPRLSVFFKPFFTYTVTEDFEKLGMF